MFNITVWIKNKSGYIERAVIYFSIVLIKGLLSLLNLKVKFIIISIIIIIINLIYCLF